jgi:anti-sigma factor RsiW
MRCRKAKKLISAYLDGELTGARLEAVRAHLGRCPDCEAFAADLARVSRQVTLFSAPEPREGFVDRLMARLPEPASASDAGVSRSWWEVLRPAPIGLAATAFSLGVILTVLVNAESTTNGTNGQQDVEVLAGNYFETLSDISIDEQLLALIPDAED